MFDAVTGGDSILAVLIYSTTLKFEVLCHGYERSMQPHCQHIAGRCVENRVLGEVEQNREPMPFPTAEHDEIAAELLRSANDLRFDAAGFDELTTVLERQTAGQLAELRAGAAYELAFNLHGRQQRFAHRLDGHVLDDVKQGYVCLRARGDRLGALADDLAVIR